MKFIIIHNKYSRQGGEEAVVRMQADLLARHGHKVIMFTREHGQVGKLKSFFTAIKNKQVIKDLKRVLDEENPDVAIVHNLFPVISAAILPELKKRGVQVLMTVHNYRLVCPNGLFYTHGRVCEKCGTSPFGIFNCVVRRCEGSFAGSVAWSVRAAFSKKYFRYVDNFMVLSDFQRQKITGYNSSLDYDKFCIVPNCIDISEMSESTVENATGGYVGFVGRLSEEKGVRLLFETARLLPNMRFKVAGESAENFKTGAIPDNVELVGHLDKQQLADFYSASKCIVLTSSCYEGFPLSVIEAMYYRATVIVPAWAALPEIVGNGRCGVLYEPNNAQDLAQKIMGENFVGDQAHKKIVESYDSEQYYSNILRCL